MLDAVAVQHPHKDPNDLQDVGSHPDLFGALPNECCAQLDGQCRMLDHYLYFSILFSVHFTLIANASIIMVAQPASRCPIGATAGH